MPVMNENTMDKQYFLLIPSGDILPDSTQSSYIALCTHIAMYECLFMLAKTSMDALVLLSSNMTTPYHLFISR